MPLWKLICMLMIIGIMASGIVGCRQDNPGSPSGQATSPAVEERDQANQPMATPTNQEDPDQVQNRLKKAQQEQ